MGAKLRIKDIEERMQEMDIDSSLEFLHQIKQSGQAQVDKLIEKYSRKKMLYEKELMRFNEMTGYEKEAYSRGVRFAAGIDEAGRGPLAGPVVAAAVILPENVFIENLNDSKKLTPRQRDELFDIIREKAISYGIGIVDEKCIDEINILNATKRAMCAAVKDLKPQPDLLLIDAVKLEDVCIKQIPIIKGDSLSISIAAASIIAKVTRDRIIDEMDGEYPQYGFAKHKGYGTKEHIDAIKKYGICPIHRVSFTKKFVG